MNLDKIIKLASHFFILAKAEEVPSDSSTDLSTILKNLEKLETFNARIKYADKKFTHLSSGTSRVVYVVNDGKEVLKLAKNDRGVAQNKAESALKCKYINETTESDSKGAWKISPFLDKVTEKEFEELSGANFKEFGEALEYGLQKVSDDTKSKPKGFDKIEKLDIYKKLIEVGKKHELMPGDMARISSWGQVDGHPTLLDAGLTKEIYDEFY